MLTGSLVAMHFFGTSISYIIGLIFLGYIMLSISKSVRGIASAAFILSYNLVCETWLADSVTWHMIRGPIMIVAMKIISLGFDIDNADAEKEKLEIQKLEDDAAKEELEKFEEKNKQGKNNLRNRNKKKRSISEQPSEDKEEKKLELDLSELPG